MGRTLLPGRTSSSALLLPVLLIVTCCGREALIENITLEEKMLYRYDESSDATILVTKWGVLVRKWRITEEAHAVLYQVDTNTRVCLETGAVVDCDALRRDRDMRRYITW